MFSLETTLLGFALAMDAAVVSFALGLLGPHLGKGVAVALVFGIFQFLMLWLGSFGGYFFSFSHYGHLFQLIVSAIFIFIALKVFQESFSEKKLDVKWGPVDLILLALATSVDALISGVSIGTLPMAHLAAIEVGLITFGICGLAYSLSSVIKNMPDKWLLRVAGIVFLYLGGNNIIKHFF